MLNIIQLLYIALSTLIFSILAILLVILTGSKDVAMWGPRNIWAPLILLICGVKLSVYGKENIPDEGNYIFVANHASQMDIPILFAAVPRSLYFIAKKELKKIPVFGLAITLLGMIFIDRQNRDKAKESIEKAGDSIRSERSVISFPEGTRTKTGEIGVFKRGSFVLALNARVDIIPITIKGAREILPSGKLNIRPGNVSVFIGQPISYTDFQEKTAIDYANHVQRIIKENIDRL